jgi:hypothetical protein
VRNEISRIKELGRKVLNSHRTIQLGNANSLNLNKKHQGDNYCCLVGVFPLVFYGIPPYFYQIGELFFPFTKK